MQNGHTLSIMKSAVGIPELIEWNVPLKQELHTMAAENLSDTYLFDVRTVPPCRIGYPMADGHLLRKSATLDRRHAMRLVFRIDYNIKIVCVPQIQ